MPLAVCAAAVAFGAFGAMPAFDTLIAHRGESVDAPENTLPAYRTAVERGFGFECDIYLSKDGRVFTFHDGSLARTSGGANTNRCNDATWDEVSRLDVGNWGKWKGSKFAGTRPALLEEVLELTRNGRWLYIDVKSKTADIVPYVKAVFEKQKRANPGNTLFLCGSVACGKAFKRLMPEYKVLACLNCRKKWEKGAPPVPVADIIATAREMGADGVDIRFIGNVTTDAYMKAIKDAGLELHVWTIDDLAAAVEAFRRGAQTVTTNCAKKLLDEYGSGGRALVEKRAAPLEWLFPTGDNTPHEGMAFADGVTGVLAWGGGDTLKLTVSRADLWDHRGGYTWTDAQCYTNITDAILKGDKERLLGLFRKVTPPGEPRNPFMLPLGRVEVKIPGATLKRGTLDVKAGVGTIEFDLGGKPHRVELAMSKASRAFALKLPDGITFETKAIHCMEFPTVNKRLTSLGYQPAKYSDNGFTWELPADESVTLEFAKRGGELSIATWRGDPVGASVLLALGHAGRVTLPFARVRAEAEAHWAKFWAEGARVKVPDPVIQGLFDYGMYRFGAMTDPDGVPAGLQGPWIEDNDLPPWSGDYHFNINVQECYSPAYRGGHFANMMPLFSMILSWRPILRENARKFARVGGGYSLPHSVSDKGVNIGGFWTGTIDHGSTAWVADMMWRYVKYSGDVNFLKNGAYDFMKGAMNVYRAMMTEDAAGRFAFPTGPSPEWGGSDFHRAVGRNPSFQLAAAHRLARDLIAAAAMLGERPDATWLDVEKRLPLAAIDDAQGGILLFENRPLSESHRHHSHMAGLFPFDIFDLSDRATAATVEKTYAHWRAKGVSMWAGWSLPWAAVLGVHLARPADAVSMLHDWDEYYANPGHASRCWPWKSGFAKCRGGRRIGRDGRPEEREVMQMDGQCAFAAAVLELMAHEVNGKTEFFRGCPPEWRDVSFENVALSDGRRVRGRRVDGKATVTFAE